MKSIRLTGIREMLLQEVPTPMIRNNTDVLIKMKVVGVCGSDIHYFTQGNIGSQVVEYPFTVGHEGAGIVEKTGSAVIRIKPGDRIAFDPAMPCFECSQCRAGRHHTCLNLKFLGCPGQAEGCLSDYIVLPESSCIPLHKNLSFDDAALSEPLSIGIYATKQAGTLNGLKIGILGFGPIGMSTLLSVKTREVDKIYVTDKLDDRLARAGKSGAFLTGNPVKEDVVTKLRQDIPEGLDMVFECCGQQDAINNAAELLKPGGKIIIVGIPETDTLYFQPDQIRRKELTIINIRRQNNCTTEALEMIANGNINVSHMVSHRFPFAHTKEAFDLVAGYEDGVMKAMIDMG